VPASPAPSSPVSRSIDVRIDALMRRDRLQAVAFTAAMWAVLLFVLVVTAAAAPSAGITVALIGSLLLLGLFNTGDRRRLSRNSAKSTDDDLSVGGAGLAASLLDLIDEFRPSVVPAFIGGGKPYVPLGADLRLRLVEQRAFRGGTVYPRYERIG
jgi:uncharacterized MnhB-related membrane protein